MSKDWKCPFCGSTRLMVDTPFIDRVTGEHEQTYCCGKQKQNAEYRNRRFGQDTIDIPEPDDVSHL